MPTGVGVIASVTVPVVAVDCAKGVSVGDTLVIGVRGGGVAVPGAGWHATSIRVASKMNRFNTLSSE